MYFGLNSHQTSTWYDSNWALYNKSYPIQFLINLDELDTCYLFLCLVLFGLYIALFACFYLSWSFSMLFESSSRLLLFHTSFDCLETFQFQVFWLSKQASLLHCEPYLILAKFYHFDYFFNFLKSFIAFSNSR